MSAAPFGTDHTYDGAAELAAEDPPIEAGDLLDDPRTNAEALCLCAVLWSRPEDVSRVVEALRRADFDRAVYGALFAIIATEVRDGRLHDPASIAGVLTQTGRIAGHHGHQLSRALSEVTMAGGAPEAAGHYAITVVSAAYRRGFHTAAASLTDAAEQLPQEQLFEHLVRIGRAQRAATERLRTITTALSSEETRP